MPLRNLFLALCLLSCAGRATATDTLKVYFPTGVSRLQATAIKTLDSALYYGLLQRDSALEILGYADFVGSNTANETLSGARAAAVKAYLLQNGFSGEKMIRTTAKGELPADDRQAPGGIAAHRRVDIIAGGKAAQEAFLKSAKTLPPVAVPAVIFIPRNEKTLSTASLTLPEIIAQTPAGSSFQLAKLFFPAGRHVMYEDSKMELEDLINALKEQPRIKIRVEGHVCCIDTNMSKDALDEQTHEYRLSGNRARFVAQYLIKGGIDAGRISHAGFGKRYALIYHESTAEEAAANRRVEIRILEK